MLYVGFGIKNISLYYYILPALSLHFRFSCSSIFQWDTISWILLNRWRLMCIANCAIPLEQEYGLLKMEPGLLSCASERISIDLFWTTLDWLHDATILVHWLQANRALVGGILYRVSKLSASGDYIFHEIESIAEEADWKSRVWLRHWWYHSHIRVYHLLTSIIV